MSSQSNSSARSPRNMDPLELLDFSEYDGVSYRSPSVSPSATTKPQFSRPVTTAPTPTPMPSNQRMSGPSHQYDMYKQQTPFVPGAVATTLAVNQNSNMSGYTLDYMASEMNNSEVFDFNTAPSQGSMQNSEMDMDFESPAEPGFFFPEPTINPSATQALSPPVLSSHSNVGRMYPGMHQQAAMAKAQAQQRQQQQIIQQQQQMRQGLAGQQPKQQRTKSAQPSDPIVEQKISQLLNSMRAKTVESDGGMGSPMGHLPRTKKDEEEMDEDERLLASEEGKKLSSKERRQLRNKVSARAFRSRRKEYITQLESEIASKVTENGDLRAQNRALMEENKRLSDLTRMLLSSPSFSNFLDNLSSNPSGMPQQQQQPQQVEQRQPEGRQLPKDVNPYAASQNAHHQQIGMAMIPEQTMDFSMLSLDTADGFNYQPQVFAVLETPEFPVIDTDALAGKSSNFAEPIKSEEKLEIPTIECPVPEEIEKPMAPKAPTTPVVDEEFENDPAFALYHDAPASDIEAAETDSEDLANMNIFGGIEAEKALARYELVDASTEEAAAAQSLAKIHRITASLESLTARLELLTVEL